MFRHRDAILRELFRTKEYNTEISVLGLHPDAETWSLIHVTNCILLIAYVG
jgi:hypothetical protein